MVSAALDDNRCPLCSALVRPGSQWCTLCYADLRPAPVVQPAAEQHARAERGPQPKLQDGAFDPLTAPLALLDREEGAPGGQVDVAGDPPAGKHAARSAEPEVGWPCARCGTIVPFDESSCTACGAGFLENVDPKSGARRLGLGSGEVSKQTKALIVIGGSFGVLVLLLGLMYVLGAVL